MQGNRSRDTNAELAVRRLLHARGLRYRVNDRPVPELRRTADIVFTRQRIAVFIDGCFWHGCPEHYTRPGSNQEFWDAKVTRNKVRDADTVHVLEEHAWTVLRFWEHVPAMEISDAIERTVGLHRDP